MTLAAKLIILLGAVLIAVSGLGLLRLPDVFARMHASTKSTSLGFALALVGAAILLGDSAATIKLALAVLFQLFTAPTAAQVLGRAAYSAGVPLWRETRWDDLGQAGLREARSGRGDSPSGDTQSGR